ncbi:hypothetical protein HHI36_012115 [Cryptolaemus montrouzieri]|uniref:Uncharacterized protein n=1 Tax=Cryptolaemus montrouzieri TaxID=559131 RepID=A0ABD2NE22_9CUCU
MNIMYFAAVLFALFSLKVLSAPQKYQEQKRPGWSDSLAEKYSKNTFGNGENSQSDKLQDYKTTSISSPKGAGKLPVVNQFPKTLGKATDVEIVNALKLKIDFESYHRGDLTDEDINITQSFNKYQINIWDDVHPQGPIYIPDPNDKQEEEECTPYK